VQEDGKRSIVWIVAATDKLRKIYQKGGRLNSEIASGEFKQQVVDVVWMKEMKKFR
jgi:hypothetical protein